MIQVSRPDVDPMEEEGLIDCIREGWITQGWRVRAFEHALSKQLRAHVVACSSGTAALHLALVAAGIEAGDEVLVPDLAYVAVANAVRYCGAKPVLVDVRWDDWLIDLDLAEKQITSRTRAIIGVSNYGVPIDSIRMNLWALKHGGLLVVEDAAEAYGGSRDGVAAGTGCAYGTFSFYGNKIVTTAEGGAVVTHSEEAAERLRLLRGQGQGTRRFFHEALGFNYRMSDLHAAIGLAQMRRSGSFLRHRRDVFETYAKVLPREFLAPCLSFQEGRVGPWLATILLPTPSMRLTVEARLHAEGIETRPVFVPMHEQPYLREYRPFPVADLIAARGLSLPTSSTIPLEHVETIARIVLQAVERAA